MRKFIFIGLLATLFVGCATFKYKKQGFVSDSNYFKEIPFQYENGFIILPVQIQGKTYNFLLDTGAELNLIDPSIADELRTKKLKNGTISNASDSQNGIKRVEIDAISIGGIDFKETVAMIWDINKFSKYISCQKIDGFIGNNLMRKSNWQIDYNKQLIRISDSSTRFNYSNDLQMITMNSGVVGNVHLDVKLAEKNKAFTFDTGFNGFIQTGDTTLLKNIPSITKIGLTGANFSGAKTGATYYKKLKSFEIQGIQYSSPYYFLIKSNNSSILGNAFFENYTITLDWDNDSLILDKVNDYGFSNSPIFEVGFFADLEKGIVTIANIHDDSELFGKIQPNTRVLKINNIDLVSLKESGQLCEFWHKKWNQFSKNDELNLVVETNGTPESLKVKKIQW